MTFAAIHQRLQDLSPLGAGFAVSGYVIEELIAQEISALTAAGGTGQDIAVVGFPKLSFSIDVKATDLRFDVAKSSVSVDSLIISLHISGEPLSQLAAITYRIPPTEIEVRLDTGNVLILVPKISTEAQILDQQDKSTDALIARAGFTDSAGKADRRRYLEDFYYGFVFVTTRGMAKSIIGSLPLPQLHKWLRGIKMVPPFLSVVESGYLAVYTELASLDLGQCSLPTGPTQPSTSELIPGNSAPGEVLSAWDSSTPPYVIYSSGQVLLDWYSGAYAPAVMLSDGGGGFVSWSVDAAIAITRLRLTFSPSAFGGTLEADLGMRLIGMASAWVNGPSNTRADIANVSVTGDGHARGVLTAELDPNSLAINYNADITGEVDRNTVVFHGGGIVGSVVATIAETLVRTGGVELHAEYRKRGLLNILDAAKTSPATAIMQRTSNTSAAIGIGLRPGLTGPA